ncbi:MAG TPA: cupredoxin domain-containing protein [Solirubrobacteraceae bacterium]|jgi:plastocyanin|nr:cupredoxin domain-containing protein [Solirubrobacteraceae bacterium]
MSRPTIIALMCGALALGGAFVAGCGSSDKKASTTPAAPAGSTSGTTATPATPGTPATGAVNVVMQNNLFSPEEIKVKVGQKIHWTNNDPYPHNVTAKNGAFKSGNLNGGKTFDFTAKKVGRIPYVCTIHSGQKGAIVVTA